MYTRSYSFLGGYSVHKGLKRLQEVMQYTGDYTLNFKGYTVHRSLGGYCVQ